MTLTIRHADGPIGACVEGVDLRDLAPQDYDALIDLFHERSVVAVRGQTLAEEDQVRFAGRYGPLKRIFIEEAASTKHPELFIISNIVEGGRPIGNMDAGQFWHTDGAYLKQPHSASMLYAVEVPTVDGVALGDTCFIGMAAAFAALPEAMQQRLRGLRAVHSLHHRYGEKAGSQDMARRSQEFPPVSHPLVIDHPVTGRPSLYLSEGYTTTIEGLDPPASRALLDELLAHIQQARFKYQHHWAPGDLLMWDNRATLHRATFDYPATTRRLMRRATVAGTALG